MARKKVTEICTFPGCEKHQTKTYPYCAEHMHRANQCKFDDCERPIAAYNKSGYCYDHRWYAQKEARAARITVYRGFR